MTDILNKLDTTMLGIFPNEGITFKGLCQLVTKGDQTHPVEVDSQKQVSISDRWPVLVYHRILNGSMVPSDEQAFGRKTGKKLSQQIRTVVVAKSNKGEDWVDTFAQQIPETLVVTDGTTSLYEYINIEEITLIKDHLAVHNAEFGETNYEKHIQNYNVYALEYDIEFQKCL